MPAALWFVAYYMNFFFWLYESLAQMSIKKNTDSKDITLSYSFHNTNGLEKVTFEI